MSELYFFNKPKKEKIQEVEKFILYRKITECELRVSIRSSKSVYNDMCTFLKIKNTRNNRLRLYNFIYLRKNGLVNRMSTPLQKRSRSPCFDVSLISDIINPNPNKEVNGIKILSSESFQTEDVMCANEITPKKVMENLGDLYMENSLSSDNLSFNINF